MKSARSATTGITKKRVSRFIGIYIGILLEPFAVAGLKFVVGFLLVPSAKIRLKTALISL